MKLRQEHVKTFKARIEELRDEAIPMVLKSCEEWLNIQRERATYGNVDQDDASWARDRIEDELTGFRTLLGEIYDYMSERGLRNINGNEGE